MFGFKTYIIQPLVSGLKALNQTCSNATGVTEAANKGYVHLTKVTGASVGSAGLAKGAVDLVEAVICQDGVCAVISAVGCVADSITIATNFVPGANVSTVVTVPVSLFCKVFVYCCKRAQLPWGCRK